jgi:maltooligosyltrehalose trehalohydrolase
VQVLVANESIALEAEDNGYFCGRAPHARAGMNYRYVLDGGEAFPDPASRFQPEGPHGPSQIVDPDAFHWTDQHWPGVELSGQVIYELHVGTFTREGTWDAATQLLDRLARTGITVIEVMPVADFSGEFGWGYDGVNWFAPCRLYGSPDDMRRFIDTAHALGIGVILDVVYNHFGPDGNYVGQFSRDYFTHKHTTDWGDAINYDGENCAAVRDFVTSNAAYWIDEYHLDGLRLDATQNIYDDSKDHILAGITRSVRRAAGKRKTIVVAENEPQNVRLVKPANRGGYGMDGLWNVDFHHSAGVAGTGRNEAFYTDYLGKPQELVSAMKYGYLYQGQWYTWQKQERGTPSLNIPQSAFVTFVENHDQVANSARGIRLHQLTSPGMYRAITALTLLGPCTPMLFQGQEFGSTAPFLFFADMPDCLVQLVRDGRKEFLRQWRSIHTRPMLDVLSDPCSRDTFERCKLDHSEHERNREAYRFHCDLIELRRSDPVLGHAGREKVDGAVLSPDAFLLRFFGPEDEDRLLLVNLGRDLPLSPAPEPLLAPPAGCTWRTLLSTESPHYGGTGAVAYEDDDPEWTLTGQAAVVLASCPTDRNLNDSKEKTNE